MFLRLLILLTNKVVLVRCVVRKLIGSYRDEKLRIGSQKSVRRNTWNIDYTLRRRTKMKEQNLFRCRVRKFRDRC